MFGGEALAAVTTHWLCCMQYVSVVIVVHCASVSVVVVVCGVEHRQVPVKVMS